MFISLIYFYMFIGVTQQLRKQRQPVPVWRRDGQGCSVVEVEAVFVQVALEQLTSAVAGSDQKCFEIAQCLVKPHQISAHTVVDLHIHSSVLRLRSGISCNRRNMGISSLKVLDSATITFSALYYNAPRLSGFLPLKKPAFIFISPESR